MGVGVGQVYCLNWRYRISQHVGSSWVYEGVLGFGLGRCRVTPFSAPSGAVLGLGEASAQRRAGLCHADPMSLTESIGAPVM